VLTIFLVILPALLLAQAAPRTTGHPPDEPDTPHVVFIAGDEEYRSEESLPLLASILARDHGVRTTVLYSLDENGFIDPNALDNIPGTDVLATADLVVMFTRFRALPDEQLAPILDYAKSGRPIVGLRTATHAFRYPDDDLEHAPLNGEWPRQLFGQRWITHHGHFDDGKSPLTHIEPVEGSTHPILRGVAPFDAYSWLYHVEGGGDSLSGEPTSLATGTTLKSYHAERHDRFPASNPVAWIYENDPKSGRPSRVFFTTLGHPYDFRSESCRRLIVQGLLWALGREASIPAAGIAIRPTDGWRPPNSGIGNFRPNQTPESIASPAGTGEIAPPQ
jgi:type 1 glutamine amidotransferase